MGKSAKKRKRNQGQSASRQQPPTLTAFMRRNLYGFVMYVGMKALEAVLEQDREMLCGPAYAKGAPDSPVRWGRTDGRLVVGGRRITVRRPRVRQQGEEVALPSWAAFAAEDPLDMRTYEQMILGVSTRNYDRSVEELPDELSPHGASKSAASRRFVAQTTRQLREWQQRDLSELALVAVMLDGIGIGEHTVVVALGVDEDGRKHTLGLWLGATENAVVCGDLLDNLIERGLDPLQPYLFVIDGGKALRKAIRLRFGTRSLVQRCQEHKRRNVIAYLPKELHRSVRKAMGDAYKSGSKSTAKRRLQQLVSCLRKEHPDAAASLREGLDETLTILGLGLSKNLARIFSTTNAIENINSTIRRITRNVKRWRNGEMVKRWTCTALIEAQNGFRRIRGYRDMPKLVSALRRNAERIDRVDANQKAA